MAEKELEVALREKSARLRAYLRKFNTESVLGLCASTIAASDDLIHSTGLSSPYKQLMYLCALHLSSDPAGDVQFGTDELEKARVILEDIINAYAFLFFPPPGTKREELSADWFRSRDISMLYFLHYFNTTDLRYEDQIEQCGISLFEPFDAYVYETCGFHVSTAFNFSKYCGELLQANLDAIGRFKEQAEGARDDVLNRIPMKDFTIERVRQLTQELGYMKVFDDLMEHLNNLHQVQMADLFTRLPPDEVEALVRHLSSTRRNRDYLYFTEASFFEMAPLWITVRNTIFIAFYKQLIVAIFNFIYLMLENSERRSSFYQTRDSYLEDFTERCFVNLLNARYFASVCEDDRGQNEHDGLVVHGDSLIIVECKATKRKEPFRDPDKAALRIERDFKSDHGIQRAYDQALRLKKHLLSQPTTTLYSKRGGVEFVVERELYKRILIILVTLDDFGPIALNLSILLSKPHEEPYPFCLSVANLEVILNAFKYKGKSVDDFILYLSERERYHAKFMSDDELELAGHFLVYGGFGEEIKGVDKIGFTYGMSDIFDEIWYQQRGIDYKAKYEAKPVFVDISKILRRGPA